MKKGNRKIIAIVCIMALLISSFATYSARTDADVDPSGLNYTMVESGGNTIGYNVVSNTLLGGGGAPWYGDGGITFQIVFSGAVEKNSVTVKINGVDTSSGVVSLINNGLVKLNPTLMDNDAYTHIEINTTDDTYGSAELYIKKGNPGGGETSTEETSERGEGAELLTPFNDNWNTPAGAAVTASQVAAHVPGYASGNYYDTQLVKNELTLTSGKWYTASVTLTSTVARKFQLLVQSDENHGGDWSVLNSQQVFQTEANVSKTFTTTFQASNIVGNYLFGIMMGYVDGTPSAECDVTVTAASLKEYSQEPPTEAPTESSVVPTESTTAPDVQDITITPRTSDIELHNNIWADWDNPAGTDKAYVYLEQVDYNHAAATLNKGWIFNDQATQPMTSVDNVAQTRDASVKVRGGVTYTLIVEAFNSNNQKIGAGSVEIAMPRTPGGPVVFTNAVRHEYVHEGKSYYALYANWEEVPGAAGYKSYINVEDDDHKAKASNNGWVWSDNPDLTGSADTRVEHVGTTKDDTVLEDDQSYTLIVVAYDVDGEEIGRGSITVGAKPSIDSLNYTRTEDIYVSDSTSNKLPVYCAIYDAETTNDVSPEAPNWNPQPRTYNDRYANITWGLGSVLESPDSVSINGTTYTEAGGPIFEFVNTLVNIRADAVGGLEIGYNKVRITKDDKFVTVIFRVGGVVAPVGVTASEQEGVPGSIRVDWTPGEGTPFDQVYRVYVDGDMKKGNLTGTSAIINNIDAGTHTVKVVGFYLDKESAGVEATVSVSTGVKYSSSISIEGFQIRSNYPDDATETEKKNIAYRTMCKAPKAGNTIKVGGKTYTVGDVGTIYAIDTNTKDKEGTNVLDASYTLLNETPVTGQQYTYTGLRQYSGENVTYGYVAGDEAIISDYKAGDTDNVYYAFTMRNMNEQMANTLWVRPFVVATDGTIIYGRSTAYTSVAEIANVLYTNSMSKNVTSHNYLFINILNNTEFLKEKGNPFYRDTEIQYGWNGNLYIGFRKVPDSWNETTGIDEGTYIPVGDWRIHNSSHYNEQIEGKHAAASYKGNTNDEMEVRVDNPGAEFRTEGFMWNWGIQMKLTNQLAYNRLEDGRKYRMTITYNTTKAGIMRIKTEGNSAANIIKPEGYWQTGHDLVYDFDAEVGGNSHSIEFTFDKNKYVSRPGADPSVVICPGRFNVYPFGEAQSQTYGNDCRAMLHIKYMGQYKDVTSTVTDVGGFPAGTIISDVDITFTEIDEFAPDSPNVLH